MHSVQGERTFAAALGPFQVCRPGRESETAGSVENKTFKGEACVANRGAEGITGPGNIALLSVQIHQHTSPRWGNGLQIL